MDAAPLEKIESFPNNFNGAKKIESYVAGIAEKHKASPLLIATEATSFIRALKASVKEVNAAIEKAYEGFSLTLDTIPGIGVIFAAGIFAEIGSIERFASEAQLAR